MLTNPGESVKAPRQKPRRSPSPRPRPASNKPVGVLAPKKTGVFADTQVKAPVVVSPRRAQQRVRQAEERMPGTTAPVRRYPDLKEPTHAQAQTIVRGTRRALRSLTVEQKNYALANGDSTTRQQLRIALKANERLDRDQRVRIGLSVVRAKPEAFGLTGQAARDVQRRVRGRLPSAVRGALAHVGAETLRQHPGVQLKVRGPHGAKKGAGLLGVAAIDLAHGRLGAAVSRAGAGAGTLAAAGIKGAAAPVANALRSAGADLDSTGHPNILKNALKDAIHFPYDAVNSGAEIARATQEAAFGDPTRARKLLGSLDDGVIGALVGGHPELAGKRFVEHPLYGASEFTGVASAAGRTIGAIGRSGLVGERVADALATARSDLRASRHGGVSEQRSYSRNAFVNLGQKASDRRALRRGLDPTIARTTRQSERMLRRGANEEIDAAEVGRRSAKTRAGREITIATRGGKRGPARTRQEQVLRNVVGQAAEGRLGSHADLRAAVSSERARLEGVWASEHRTMTLSDRQVLRAQIGDLRKFEARLATPKGAAAADELLSRAAAVREAAHGHTDRAVELNMLAPEQAEAAQLRSFAVTRLGARYVDTAALKRAGERQVRLATQRLADAAAHGSPADVAAAQQDLAIAGQALAKARRSTSGLVVDAGRGRTRELPLDEIKQAWAAEHPGEALPAFISHQARTSAGARFVNFSGMRGPQRVTVDANRRTGEGARRGTADVRERGVVDATVHTAGAISAVENFNRLMQRFGSKREDGKLFTPDEAAAEIQARTEGLNDRVPEVEWGAYAVAPQRFGADRIAEIGRSIDAEAGARPAGLVPDALRELRADDDPGRRNVILLPKQVAETIMAHQSPTTSELAKSAQAFTNLFRSTVLPTSTKWLFGNAAEMALRLGLQHGPMALVDVAHGMRLQRALEAADSPIAEQLRAMTRGGQVYGSAQRLAVYRDASMFKRPGFKQAGAVAHGVRQAELQGLTERNLGLVGKIGPKAVFDGYKAFADAVIKLNHAFEQAGDAAVVGKVARREAQEMTRSWAKSLLLQGKTFEALVSSDRVNSVEWATKAAREIDKTLGKYSRFSPEMRRLTQTIAPFLPWYLNAARFVYWTLPVENPIKTALLTRIESTFDQEMQQQADALPPGDLGANPQRGDGGIVPVTRYTPFGAFTPFGRDYQSVLQEAASPILPQLSTPLTIAIFGENFAHRRLQKADGSDVTQGDRAQMAAYSLFESIVPFTQIVRRLRENGGTGYDDSTALSPKAKPNTAHGRSAASRIFVPWSPTFLQGAPAAAPVRAAAPAAPQTLEQRAAAALAAPETSGPDDELQQRGAAALAGP